MPARKKAAKPTTKKELTLKQKSLAERALHNALTNGRKTQEQLAIESGYSPKSAVKTGCETLNKPEIKEYIQERVLGVTIAENDEILGLLATHMRGDFGDFGVEAFKDDGSLDLQYLKRRGLSRLVKKMRTKVTFNGNGEKEVTTDIEMHDSQSAADKLMKHRGLYTEKAPHPQSIDVLKAKLIKEHPDLPPEIIDSLVENPDQYVN